MEPGTGRRGVRRPGEVGGALTGKPEPIARTGRAGRDRLFPHPPRNPGQGPVPLRAGPALLRGSADLCRRTE